MLRKLKKAIKLIAMLSLAGVFMLSVRIGYRTYIYGHKGDSIVYMLTSPRSGGTGFQVIAPSGQQYTITNRHICHGRTELQYRDENDKTGIVKVIEIAKNHDLCILEPIKSLPALSVANFLFEHEEVSLIGHPNLRPLTWELGHFIGYTHINLRSKCEGESKYHEKNIVIVARGYYCSIRISANMFNTNAYGGNSGSPILDFKGDVVGVLYAVSPSQPDISYAVPLDVLKEFLKDY